MALVHGDSQECKKSELDLFTTPTTQTSISKGSWIEYHPLSNITESGPIEFYVLGSGEEYLDLARTQLFVKAKIVKADGTDVEATTQVGPTNLFLHSLFSQVDVSLNVRLISSSTNTYAYRAMLETLLNYGDEAKKSQLTMSLFYRDTPGKMDTVNPLAEDDDANLGLKARFAFTKSSNIVDMMGTIHSDVFFQEGLLLIGVNWRIKLNRAKNFLPALLCHYSKFQGYYHRSDLICSESKSGIVDHPWDAATLRHTTAKYPLRCVDCKVLTIPRGFSSFNPDNIFLGRIPKRIVFGLVDTEAFNGSYTTNPFNFKHYNLSLVGVYVDGEQILPKPLTLKFDADGGQNFMAGFQTLFSGIGKLSQDAGNQIARGDYGSGYTLFCFDLTPDECSADHFQLIKQGNLRVELHFAEPLPKTVNLIIYAESESLIEIDSNRNVLYDYNN